MSAAHSSRVPPGMQTSLAEPAGQPLQRRRRILAERSLCPLQRSECTSACWMNPSLTQSVVPQLMVQLLSPAIKLNAHLHKEPPVQRLGRQISQSSPQEAGQAVRQRFDTSTTAVYCYCVRQAQSSSAPVTITSTNNTDSSVLNPAQTLQPLHEASQLLRPLLHESLCRRPAVAAELQVPVPAAQHLLDGSCPTANMVMLHGRINPTVPAALTFQPTAQAGAFCCCRASTALCRTAGASLKDPAPVTAVVAAVGRCSCCCWLGRRTCWWKLHEGHWQPS